MRRLSKLMTALWLLCAVVATPSRSFSQRVIKISQDKAFPSAYDLYPANDPYRDLKIFAEEEMGLYLVDPPRRHASEITRYQNDQLHFHIWRPLSGTKQSLWSSGAGWLLFGRIKYSRGASQLFADIPGLKRITISFHEVIRPDKKGRRRSKAVDKVYTYLTLSITRKDFERLDAERIKSCARLEDCSQEERQMLSLVKFNSKYIRRRSR